MIKEFKHVTCFDNGDHNGIRDDKRLLIVAMFDGEPELWLVNSGSCVASAISELTDFYRDDWKGTNRLIPLKVMQPIDYACVICL